ncbi:MAG: Ig-like domain-containing protein, partial [Pseudomonadota bacterium]
MTNLSKMLRGIALCSATLLPAASALHAQAGPPFPCDGNIYQVQSGQLRIFDPITSTYTNVGPQNGSYNATGFNVLDNYAYASQGGNIIRISANGVIENVFSIGFGTFSGDVDYSNNYYLRRNNNRYARINLATGAIVDVDFAGPGGGPADVAFIQDGTTEYLIGFAGGGGGTMYRYNITTQTKENISLPGLPGGGFGAAWTDSTGRLFTFNNGNGLLYEVTDYLTNSPSFTQVGVGDPSGNNDGFSCSLAPFPNLAPLAFDDDFTGPLNLNVTGDVLPDNGNGADNDPEGFALTVNTTPLSGPSNGSVVLNPNGSFVYTPSTNFIGVDTFDYEISDT